MGFELIVQKYVLKEIEMTSEIILVISNQKHHPILCVTNKDQDEVYGKIFKITPSELLKAVAYEQDDYVRIEAILK